MAFLPNRLSRAFRGTSASLYHTGKKKAIQSGGLKKDFQDQNAPPPEGGGASGHSCIRPSVSRIVSSGVPESFTLMYGFAPALTMTRFFIPETRRETCFMSILFW